jgi:hypothetical protein
MADLPRHQYRPANCDESKRREHPSPCVSEVAASGHERHMHHRQRQRTPNRSDRRHERLTREEARPTMEGHGVSHAVRNNDKPCQTCITETHGSKLRRGERPVDLAKQQHAHQQAERKPSSHDYPPTRRTVIANQPKGDRCRDEKHAGPKHHGDEVAGH